MNTAEKHLWEWLEKGTRGLGKLHFQRIENTTGTGTLDTEGCWGSESFWLELKIAVENEDGTLDTGLRRGQALFMARRRRACGRAAVLIQVDSATRARRYLIDGLKGTVLRGEHVREEDLANWNMLTSPHAQPMEILDALTTWEP